MWQTNFHEGFFISNKSFHYIQLDNLSETNLPTHPQSIHQHCRPFLTYCWGKAKAKGILLLPHPSPSRSSFFQIGQFVVRRQRKCSIAENSISRKICLPTFMLHSTTCNQQNALCKAELTLICRNELNQFKKLFPQGSVVSVIFCTFCSWFSDLH